MSEKGEGRSDVYAQIVEDKVTVHSTKKSGYKIGFDKIPTLVRRWYTQNNLKNIAAQHFRITH